MRQLYRREEEVQEHVLPPSDALQLGLKRIVDIACSTVLIITFSPVMVVTAIAIKLDSPGPMLFNRQRIGKDGAPFVMLKFRTMVSDAEARLQRLQHLNEGGGYMIKIKDDPRITRMGRFLRTSSIDELPQLVNVLKGEMSLIGPRPQAPNEVALYTETQRQRLLMKPGITGWWQVEARHSPLFDDMVNCDLEYISRWSLGFDLEIAGRTVGQILGDVRRLLGSKRRAQG